MRDIVSGPTDADKLDYLLRDSYFAGVNYGRYDLDRIIDSVRVIAPRSAQTQLGFNADGLWAVEELLLARHHMHRQVYRHKTRLATDIMDRDEAFVALIAERGLRVEDPAPTPGATNDPDDDYLVALAQAHGVEAIVSGDGHLLSIASDELRGRMRIAGS